MSIEAEKETVEQETEHNVELEWWEEVEWDMGSKTGQERRWMVCQDCGLAAKDSYHFRSTGCE